MRCVVQENNACATQQSMCLEAGHGPLSEPAALLETTGRPATQRHVQGSRLTWRWMHGHPWRLHCRGPASWACAQAGWPPSLHAAVCELSLDRSPRSACLIHNCSLQSPLICLLLPTPELAAFTLSAGDPLLGQPGAGCSRAHAAYNRALPCCTAWLCAGDECHMNTASVHL